VRCGHRNQAALFAAIRRDAAERGLSHRALADRYGVHRRTVLQALQSPVPAPRKPQPPHTEAEIRGHWLAAEIMRAWIKTGSAGRDHQPGQE
jgi:hypothetical protein